MVIYDRSAACCFHHGARIRIANLLPLILAVACACLGNLTMPAYTSIPVPNGFLLLTLWVIATIPPTSYFGATVCILYVGYSSHGISGMIVMGILTTVGSTSMIASNFSLHAVKLRFLSTFAATLSRAFRILSSVTMATVWSMPAPLTLIPRLIFVLYFEITVLITYRVMNLIDKLCGKSDGQGNNDDIHQQATFGSQGSQNLPVMLVHGLGGSKARWQLGRLLLESKGRVLSPVSTFNFSSSDSDGIDEIAQKLSAQIQLLIEETGSRKIALIGHSVGGLICSHFVEKYAAACGIEVSLVVCIGTPWTGLADFSGPQWLQVQALHHPP
jgi:hypothetical protein